MTELIKLRDGTTTTDPRLARLELFDERSRDFKAITLKDRTQPRSYTWRCNDHLDQGREGACVGFGITHELIARPAECGGNVSLARTIYKEAQKIDPWPGENYEGTSVLAGVKVAQSMGYFDSYYWCFGAEELAVAVSWQGPVVLGVRWFEGMHSPDKDNYIQPSGKATGGHCLLCKGYSARHEAFILHNSWGTKWGKGGDCYISFNDMERLLSQGGEAVMFVGRKKK